MTFANSFMRRKIWFSLVTLVLAVVFTPLAAAQIQIPPPARVVQLPTFGVSVDADGVFNIRQFAVPGGQQFMRNAVFAQTRLPRETWQQSDLRKISLRRLTVALQRCVDEGLEPTETMAHLAGLTSLKYVFALPDEKDVILAGPAEGWTRDADGRAVGIYTGRPTIMLDDLLVALRSQDNDRPNPWVGCSINPTADGLKRLSDYQRSLPNTIPVHAEAEVAATSVVAIERALGMANIVVFGIPADTQMARVMVEADYLMKLIAIGRQPPPIDMPTFFSESKRPGKYMLQRWWFSPDYRRVIASPDDLLLEFTGAVVKLGTEDYRIGPQGQMRKLDNKPGPATRRYATAFTKHYDRIAELSPVYAQLRNMVELLVAAAYLNKRGAFDRVNFDAGLLLDTERLPTDKLAVPRQAPFAANAAWRNHRLIAPSGGVLVTPDDAWHAANIQIDKSNRLDKRRGLATQGLAGQTNWWWD